MTSPKTPPPPPQSDSRFWHDTATDGPLVYVGKRHKKTGVFTPSESFKKREAAKKARPA